MKKNATFIMSTLSAMSALAGILHAAPATKVQTVTYNNETVTMRMDLQNLRGSNFELWSQNNSGNYDVVTPTEERSYIGTVDEYPDAVACGIIQDDGTFRGAIYFDRGVTWRTLGSSVEGTQALDYAADTFTNYQYPSASTVSSGQAGNTMYGFDVAIDAENDYYSGPGGNSMAKTFELIEYNICLTRAQYMRDALLRPYLGRVIVRSSLGQDPYNSLTGGGYLDALRTHWQNDHSDADRDLVAGVCPTKVGGGLAWVGVVGEDYGYSVNDGGSAGTFDVVFRHEIGHNWDCSHYVGGSPEGTGFMGGNATGRMSGCEVYRMLNHRNEKVASGGVLDNEGTYGSVNLPPYASLDTFTYTYGVHTSLNVDVLANDHDANGDTLTLTSFDSVSSKGGTVSQQGNNLIYTPSASYVGEDYFKYVVTDSSGQTATGVCIVKVERNEDQKLYLALDETSGTSAANEATSGSAGSLSGTDFSAASVSGKFGNALRLDGSDDYIVVDNVGISSDSVTLTAWVKPDGSQSSFAGVIFDRSNSACGLNFGSSGELRYHWNNNYWGWNSGLVPTQGQWNFVALVIEPTKATMYLNSGSGFQSAVNNVSHSEGVFSQTYLGRDPESAARSYKGDLDDVRMFKSSLDLSDLQDLYAGGKVASPVPFDGSSSVELGLLSWSRSAGATSYQVYLDTSQSTVSNANTSSSAYLGSTTSSEWAQDLQPNTTYFWRVDAVTATGTITGDVWTFTTGNAVGEVGIVGHWRFDENSGTSATDSSPNNYTGTVSGASWTSGYKENALQFDGVDDFVSFGTGPALDGVTNFTVSAWIKTSATSEQVIVQQRDTNGFNGQYRFSVNSSGQLAFWIYGDSATQFDFVSSSVVNDGQWHFVSAVRDGDNGYLYVDGNPVANASASGTARNLSSSIGVAVGRDVRDSNKAFNGSIDEVKIYSVAKTGQQLADSYNDGSNPPPANQWPVAQDSNFSVAENTQIGTSVGTVVASDPDEGDTLSYAITAGNTGGAFTIDSNGGLSTAATINFESISSYNLTVTVTDNQGAQDTASVNVTVTNVNEAPTLVNTQGADAQENVAYAGNVVGSDPDSGDSLSYSKVSGPSWLTVSSNGSLSGTPSSVDVGVNMWTVRVSDAGGLFGDASLTITVNAEAGEPTVSSAVSQQTSSGTAAGGYQNVHVNDGVLQQLTEEVQGKNARRARSALEHRWEFNVASGSEVTLRVDAFHSVNSEGDDFSFAYSTDGSNYTDVLTVTKVIDDGVEQTASLPSSLSGTVYIRVIDTDRTRGNAQQDSLFVDLVTIEVTP